MTKILALDTSTDACSVALACDGDISEDFAVVPREHTRRLLPMVDALLSKHSLKLQDLDAIAFGRGPGSFTGLRICLGVVQGLAFGANLPVVPVSTLSAMAAGAFRQGDFPEGCELLVALDARMDEIYWSLYKNAPDTAIVQPLQEEFVMSPELVADQLGEEKEKLVGIGPGWHYPALQALNPLSIHQDCYPHAHDIAALACKAFAQGETISAMEAEPVYLRDKVSWKKRQRIRTDTSNNT